jgi:hypothetical protein
VNAGMAFVLLVLKSEDGANLQALQTQGGTFDASFYCCCTLIVVDVIKGRREGGMMKVAGTMVGSVKVMGVATLDSCGVRTNASVPVWFELPPHSSTRHVASTHANSLYQTTLMVANKCPELESSAVLVNIGPQGQCVYTPILDEMVLLNDIATFQTLLIYMNDCLRVQM